LHSVVISESSLIDALNITLGLCCPTLLTQQHTKTNYSWSCGAHFCHSLHFTQSELKSIDQKIYWTLL